MKRCDFRCKYLLGGVIIIIIITIITTGTTTNINTIIIIIISSSSSSSIILLSRLRWLRYAEALGPHRELYRALGLQWLKAVPINVYLY